MAESPDLLLFVESVCSHFHASDGHHVVVHLLQLALGGVEGEGGGIELVGFEGGVREAHLEGCIVFLYRLLGSKV